MYKIPKYSKTMIVTKPRVEGETIETKCKRILVNKEPIKDGAPLIYTDRKEGIHGCCYCYWKVPCQRDRPARSTELCICKIKVPELNISRTL